MSTFEKSVKGATKVKLAPPKSKYIEHILQATRSGEAGVAEVFRSLQYRLRDTTWTIAFKSLIVVHLMIREGENNATLAHLSTNPRQILGGPLHTYAEVQTQGRNIRHYTNYFIERARSYHKPQIDYVLSGEGRMKRLTIDKGLLKETESVQDQIQALLKCDLLTEEPENEISLTAFRLLTMDLLALFPVMNEGAINVLEHFFELSKPDAERALGIYKRFATQTDLVVRYLSVAKHHEQATRLEIPKIKHAPLSLATSLEEYLNDMDFESNRRQYLVMQQAKGSKVANDDPSEGSFGYSKSSTSRPTETQSSTNPPASHAKPQRSQAPQLPQLSKGPAPDLMDFFDSIEPKPQSIAQQPTSYLQSTQSFAYGNVPQQTGYPNQGQSSQMPAAQSAPPQSFNPFGQPQQQPQIQPQFTGAGFGGYGPQPQQQFQQFTSQQQPQMGATYTASGTFGSLQQQHTTGHGSQQIEAQQTNPFRQSATSSPISQFPTTFGNTVPASTMYSSNNPFGRPSDGAAQAFAPGPEPLQQTQQFDQQMPQPQFQQSQQYAQQAQPAQSLISQPTGTNPFVRAPAVTSQPQSPAAIAPVGSVISHATGSTNPFRQSAFVNQQTGQGWQNAPQATMGGLEALETVPVFPRPGQPQQSGQQTWYQ